jgi:hypothetical protein
VTDANNSGATYAAFLSLPTPSRSLVIGLKSQSIGTEMNNSPYLDRPLLLLAVVLPRMLEKIEADLATAGPAKTRRLRQRAELIRGLLTPSQSPTPIVT